jgi:2-polyprenyl-3-methyl-5-hydroxy-6-metoxy-1,4-benzoquinol methylase
MTGNFDNYLSTHFGQLGSAQGREHRAQALRANYLELFRSLDPAAAVLEIGPGHGELLAILRNELRLSGVRAVDLSPQVVAACNAQFGEAVELVDDTRRYLEERAGSFDVIVLLHVLEHVPKGETIALLAAIRAALKPGGRVVIEVPNMGNPIVGLTGRYADFTHETGFTEASLQQVLRMAAFERLEVRPFRIPRTSLARWIQWAARGALETAMRLVTTLYTVSPELNSANIVAIAEKSGAAERR